MLRELFQNILDCASEYDADGNVLMDERQDMLGEATRILREWIRDEAPSASGEVDLRVEWGGQSGSFAPVGWIRIFSPLHSPRPTDGIYLVYLFSADGGSFFLSLNQGTSEWRSNKMRPINDPTEVSEIAAASRLALEGQGLDLVAPYLADIDLRVAELPINAEARKRAHNYELANIYALPYLRDAVPTDEVLKYDLLAMLPLLLELYGLAPQMASSASASSSQRGGGQGRLDPLSRAAVEHRAMDVAEEHLEALGFNVERVHLVESYDLCCIRDSEELHVECKGTTGKGYEVSLPRNEVKHARAFPNVALAVVSEIELDRTLADAPTASGGKLVLLNPWQLDESRLSAMTYVYRLAPEEIASAE